MLPRCKLEGVQITEEFKDEAIVAVAFGKSVPEYVEELLRGALAKDLPHALAIAKKRSAARQQKKGGE
jgi:hypothetical protein